MSDSAEAEVAAGSDGGEPAEPRTLAGKLWFWLPWPGLVALDLWSKAAAFSFLADKHPMLPEQQRPPHLHKPSWTCYLPTASNLGTTTHAKHCNG